jgi:hypothetical protein
MRANCMRANFFSAAQPTLAAACGEGAELRRLPQAICFASSRSLVRQRGGSGRERRSGCRETRGDGELALAGFTRSKAKRRHLLGTTSSAPHGALALSASARAPLAIGGVVRAAALCPAPFTPSARHGAKGFAVAGGSSPPP